MDKYVIRSHRSSPTRKNTAAVLQQQQHHQQQQATLHFNLQPLISQPFLSPLHSPISHQYDVDNLSDSSSSSYTSYPSTDYSQLKYDPPIDHFVIFIPYHLQCLEEKQEQPIQSNKKRKSSLRKSSYDINQQYSTPHRSIRAAAAIAISKSFNQTMFDDDSDTSTEDESDDISTRKRNNKSKRINLNNRPSYIIDEDDDEDDDEDNESEHVDIEGSDSDFYIPRQPSKYLLSPLLNNTVNSTQQQQQQQGNHRHNIDGSDALKASTTKTNTSPTAPSKEETDKDLRAQLYDLLLAKSLS